MFRKMSRFAFRSLCLLMLSGATPAYAAPYDEGIDKLQQQWAIIKYQMTDHNEREDAIFTLKHQAIDLSKAYPNKADPIIWEAIVDTTKAEIDHNFSSLLLIQQARDLLIQANKINPKALRGLGVATLGWLYFQAPKPPLSFGDMDLAKEYLEKAIALNPDSLDTNYFYGSYLHETGDDAKAKTVLTHALETDVQSNSEVADEGRRAEIQEVLDSL
jgi:tetratricopeptide (TPR) repeat protein